MSIDVKQLETNVNLHTLDPNFLNNELHYIIASDDKTFRFTNWQEQPKSGEEKFYCFLTEQPLTIPAGNIEIKESYSVTTTPVYSIAATAEDFETIIDKVKSDGSG